MRETRELCIYCHRHIAAGTEHIQPEGEACCIEQPLPAHDAPRITFPESEGSWRDAPQVERFTQWCKFSHGHDLMGQRQGEWVRYTDYASLLAEQARLNERLREHHEVIVTLKECAEAAHTRAREAEAEQARLEGENDGAAELAWNAALEKLRAEQARLQEAWESALGCAHRWHDELEAAESSLAALRDAVREWMTARDAPTPKTSIPTTTEEYHAIGRLVRAEDEAEERLRALVDPRP